MSDFSILYDNKKFSDYLIAPKNFSDIDFKVLCDLVNTKFKDILILNSKIY